MNIIDKKISEFKIDSSNMARYNLSPEEYFQIKNSTSNIIEKAQDLLNKKSSIEIDVKPKNKIRPYLQNPNAISYISDMCVEKDLVFSLVRSHPMTDPNNSIKLLFSNDYIKPTDSLTNAINDAYLTGDDIKISNEHNMQFIKEEYIASTGIIKKGYSSYSEIRDSVSSRIEAVYIAIYRNGLDYYETVGDSFITFITKYINCYFPDLGPEEIIWIVNNLRVAHEKEKQKRLIENK